MFADWLRESRHTVVFTGAGMSTESGLPDFRSAKGLWQGTDPTLLASTYALAHNREAFVAFYRMRIKGLLGCRPHAGHERLAKWEEDGLVHAVITQNVDGFHQRAGSRQVTELHGTLTAVHCQSCGSVYPAERYLADDGTVCACGGFLRPSVVLFGESLPADALKRAEEAAKRAELFLVLGSSLQVSPANLFPQIAKQAQAKLVIVNHDPTPLDDWADLVIRDRSIGDLLREVDEALRQHG